MGAWGTGPLDCDGALDLLAGIAREHATLDEDDEIVRGSVDRDAVVCALTETLVGEDWGEVYAACGIVASVLVGHDGEVSEGTRLGLPDDATGAGDPLGLGAHCGYAALLHDASARALGPAALAACQRLQRDEEWLQEWRDPERTRGQVRALERVIAEHLAPD